MSSTDEFMMDILRDEFPGNFSKRSPYRTMFESSNAVVYFQNFNKPGTPNLWYRLKRAALQTMREAGKEASVYLTNPAERLAYVLPLEEITDRARGAGWSRKDLEVNIDHANGRWKELNWTIERYRRRF